MKYRHGTLTTATFLCSSVLYVSLNFLTLPRGLLHSAFCIGRYAVGVKLSPADTFCRLSAAVFECDIIPGNVNLIRDKALYGRLKLLYEQISVSLQNRAVFFFFSWQDFLDFHVTRYMFIWVKSENLGVFFPAVQGISKQISHLMQPLVVKLDMFTLYPRKYSPSTHEGLFLVVPATFPGRQEHLTVCDRSSIRFLLQHLWAAITSHVPPSDKEEEETEKKRH